MREVRVYIIIAVVTVFAMLATRKNESDIRSGNRDAIDYARNLSYQQDVRATIALRKSCEKNIIDRQKQIKVLDSEAAANLAVSKDKINSENVHRARRAEAREQKALADNLRLRTPEYGYDCDKTFALPPLPTDG